MQESGHGEEHFQFIQRTDRKSLHSQIGLLVKKAKEIAAAELNERSLRLKNLLDEEDKFYEEEFANTVKNRIDQDIKDRKEHLHAITADHHKVQNKFLEEKRIQQVMLNCYEIREALRHQDLIETKIIQEEQILENQRKKRRECEQEKYWLELNRRRWEEYDCAQKCENQRREKIKEQMKNVLAVQMLDNAEKLAREDEEKREEARILNELIEEIRLEEFDKEHQAAPPKNLAYRDELLKEIHRRRCEKLAIWEAEKAEHAAFCRETERLEAEAREKIAQAKRDFHRSTHEYLAYVRRMQALQLGIEKMLDDRTADLYKVDICTKNNIAETMRLKREEAARCHEILKLQICEEAERRLRLEAEVRENKMPENRFAHPEVTHAMKFCAKLRHRAALDEQVIEMKRLQAEENAYFESQLRNAVDDPVACQKLAKEFLENGTDYLRAHPNWRIIACDRNKYVPRPPITEQQFKARLDNASLDKCPCPEAARRNNHFMAQKGCDLPPEAPCQKPEKAAVEPPKKPQRPGFRNCHCKFY
ncbi:meiosis-specific nuclear structural protein 1 [Drosophila pseudoobscura]|uniref:Meiosis-specific nuclear structural protein 1 n=1 Tax=Drosophila pseudoobscura pseudoobscura TaxID=46245 RepID=A0A6I8V5W6_DROPS|nr:meiosis-specific nuclear structural protein 1 [Drosophila pseudoobscura]